MSLSEYSSTRQSTPPNGLGTIIKRLLGIYPLTGNIEQERYDGGFIKNKQVPLPEKSFMNFVPMYKYDPEYKQIVGLDDIKRAVFLEFMPADTEARPEEILNSIAEKITIAMQSIPSSEPPWVLQIFINDEPVQSFMDKIKSYSKYPDEKYTKEWFKVLEKHLDLISDRRGIFKDAHNEMNWHAKLRRIRGVLYKKPGKIFKPKELDSVVNRFAASLREAGVRSRRLDGDDIYKWLLPWYSGKGEDGYEYMKITPYPLEDEANNNLPADFDLGEMCLAGSKIELNEEKQAWIMGGKLQRFISLHPIKQRPRVGLWTTETSEGASPFDKLPSGSVLAFNMIIEAVDKIQSDIEKIKESAIGSNQESESTAAECDESLKLIVKGNRLIRWFSGIYISADNQNELTDKTDAVAAAAGACNFEVFDTEDDPRALDAFVRALPFNFDPVKEKNDVQRKSRMSWDSHAARMLPLYGGGTGTGNPGNLFWTRDGQPMTFDPSNKEDRSKNAHMLILGPTGSGKTATINYKLLHTMAVNRPRLFLITALPTFRLLGEYYKSLGLTVNHIHFTPDADISIPPFADITKLVSDEAIDSERDIMGEAEKLARLFVTGGETKEEELLRRADVSLIQKAIIKAARTVKNENRDQALLEDVVKAFRTLAQSDNYIETQKESLLLMAKAMDKFTEGLDGEFFNRPGEAWPDVDVTIVELGIMARKGNEDKMAITMAGLMTQINNVVEAGQYTNRSTITVIDEAHLLVQNPLIGPYINSISAMWRTFGGWLWIATQNLHQFPDSAKQLLNQPEWWILLSSDEDDVEQIARFKELTVEQKALLKSARKEFGKYTEGVVMSKKVLSLFRNVPPGLALALAQTEQDEKAARMKVANELRASELEATFEIGRRIDEKRIKHIDDDQPLSIAS